MPAVMGKLDGIKNDILKSSGIVSPVSGCKIALATAGSAVAVAVCERVGFSQRKRSPPTVSDAAGSG